MSGPAASPGAAARPGAVAGRRILVVGGGAVGSFLAGVLAIGGERVVLVDRRAEPIGPGPLAILDPGGRRLEAVVERVRSVVDVDGPPDAIVFAVKMFDLDRVLDECGRWPTVVGLTIQNGVGAEEAALERRPGAGLVAGSITTPLERSADGPVAWRRRGGLALAPVRDPADPLIATVRAAAEIAGLPTARLTDWRAMKWSKLLANLVGNATSALVDLDPSAVYADPSLFRIERRQLLEALAVMDGLGIRPVALPGAAVPWLGRAARLPEPLARLALGRVVGGARGGKMPSLRQHLRSGSGPSEVGWLDGGVARAGEAAGVATPVNRRLAELVDRAASDPAFRIELAGHPDRVIAAVAGPDGGMSAAARDAGTDA
jgi:2-dehydropantoate 2-reductase